MSGSSEKITKTVEIEVPREVEEHARERAEGTEDVELFLLDALELEFEWVFGSDRGEGAFSKS